MELGRVPDRHRPPPDKLWRHRTSDKSVLHAYGAQADGGVSEADELPAGREEVWMSHGDEAQQLPDGFEAVAHSDQVHTGRW